MIHSLDVGRIAVFAGALVLASLGGLWADEGRITAPNQNPANASALPEDVKGVAFEQNLDAQLPLDAPFVSDTGKPTSIGEILSDGKPGVLALVYYECPMLCTVELNGILRAVRAVNDLNVGEEFNVIAISFAPDEGPELAAAKKQEYAGQYIRGNASRPQDASGWHFLTGSAESIAAVTDVAGFRYKFLEDTQQYSHASGIMVVTPEGRLSKYFYGIEYSARDLQFGLMEAAENQIGSAVDQLLLYCFHYDPITGKYGFQIMVLLRIIGSLFALGLIGFIAAQLLRDRRRRQEALS